jgi:cytidyltransferase-like protein
MISAKYPIGCVHGRFQPFHLGHLEYVLKGFEVSTLLYVGLANSDPSHIDTDASAPHRHREEANPFNYFERMEMVLGSLADAGADIARVRVVPFPINKPYLLRFYIPRTAIHLITIYDEWGETKLQALEQCGYRVEILWRRNQKLTTGTAVRALLRDGRSIAGLVPAFVTRYIAAAESFYGDD